MAQQPLTTKITVGPVDRGKKLGNITLEEARFFGRPNFSGEPDRFKDARRKFTVLIPNDNADDLRAIGWNVKTLIPTAEELAEFPDREQISHLKVMVDDGSLIQIRMGDNIENLTMVNFGVMDRTRVETMDMELRAWCYNSEEVAEGVEEPKYSARLVALVGIVRLNPLEAKYGMLGVG